MSILFQSTEHSTQSKIDIASFFYNIFWKYQDLLETVDSELSTVVHHPFPFHGSTGDFRHWGCCWQMTPHSAPSRFASLAASSSARVMSFPRASHVGELVRGGVAISALPGISFNY